MGGAALLAGAAHGQVSGSLTLDSDYRFRGVSVGEGRPAARAGVNYDAAGGWYAGGSFTRAQYASGSRYSQVTAYGGRVVALTPALNLDAGATYWWFSGGGGYNFAEAYAAVMSREWSMRVNYSPNYFRDGFRTLYFDATAHRLITDTWRVFVHAGALVRVSPRPAAVDYYSDYSYNTGPEPTRTRWDVRAGIGWNVTDDIDLQLAWARASRNGPIPATREGVRGGWVGSATWSF